MMIKTPQKLQKKQKYSITEISDIALLFNDILENNGGEVKEIINNIQEVQATNHLLLFTYSEAFVFDMLINKKIAKIISQDERMRGNANRLIEAFNEQVLTFKGNF